MIFAWNWSKQCFKKSVYHWFNKVSLEKYQFVTKKWTSSSPGNKTFQSLSTIKQQYFDKKDTITVLKELLLLDVSPGDSIQISYFWSPKKLLIF